VEKERLRGLKMAHAGESESGSDLEAKDQIYDPVQWEFPYRGEGSEARNSGYVGANKGGLAVRTFEEKEVQVAAHRRATDQTLRDAKQTG